MLIHTVLNNDSMGNFLKAGENASVPTWVVSGDSTLTHLTIDGSAAVSAPAGKTLVMTVNGTETPIAAGTYSGAITLTVR